MISVTNLADCQINPSSVVTVGTFDGVHVGHRAILNYLVRRSRENTASSTVVTFDPHPREVLSKYRVALLTTIDERIKLMEEVGVDRVVIIPFTTEFSKTSADRFVIDVLVKKIGMQEIVIGHDHHFGKGRGGSEQTLLDLASLYDFKVDVIPPEALGDAVVSSSLIREKLERKGDIRSANELLKSRYTLSGEVIHGVGRGREIGFPTANLHPTSPVKIIPANGVYAVAVRVADESELQPGMMNIGVRPTFKGDSRHLEVHIIEYEGDLYGETLTIEFLSRIRSEKKFDGINALREQLIEDQLRCIASFHDKP